MKKTFLSLACLAALALPVAQAANLLPAGATDQVPGALMAAPLPKAQFEQQPVAMAWAMDPAAELDAPAPFLAESREYWATASERELKAGLALTTTAPGALVRISPAGGAKAGVLSADPGELRLLRNGRAIPADQAFANRATADQLKRAGMDAPAGSMVVQLKQELGSGQFALQLPKASGRYLVHVFEPLSDLVLKAQAARPRLLAGEPLQVAAQLEKGGSALPAGELQAQLVSPSGRSWPLSVVDGKAVGEVPLEADPTPGLWEVQLFAGVPTKDGPAQRDVRTALEIAAPTARLAGSYAFDRGAMKFSLPVEAAAPGRYELRGVLYATGADGNTVPVAQAHSARWLDAGKGAIDLAFGAGNVPLGYGAPFELRFLELKDQSRMGTLETRELALREGSRRPRAADRFER